MEKEEEEEENEERGRGEKLLGILAVTLFSRVFTGDGTIGYMGCDSTEHRGQRIEQ